jgi:pSer/pThr/pTyr-binding forkhead associated (FHA) protein
MSIINQWRQVKGPLARSKKGARIYRGIPRRSDHAEARQNAPGRVMTNPIDDEGLGTIGLPGGAMQEIVKGPAASKPKAPTRPATEPRGIGSRGGSSGSPIRPDGGPSEREHPLAAEPENLATVPPPGARRSGLVSAPPPSPKSAQDQRLRPPIGPPEPRTRRDEPAIERAPAPPLRPSQPHPVERSLDDSDFNTNPMPKSPTRPGGSPPQRPRVERSDEIARPLPAETLAAPAGLLGSPVIRDAVKAHTDTPVQFPVSNERVRPPVASPRVDPDDGVDRTRAFFPGMLAATGRKSILQFFNNSIGEWCFLAELDGGMMVLGRSTFQGSDAGREGLSEEHVRIGIEGDELYVEPLESLNGVYRRLQPNRREELTPLTRFRIGRHVLEFRFAEPTAAIAPLRAGDGEVFQSRVLAPLGFVDLIGPDGRPYLSFPVTKREERGTRIGRAGVECDIALAGDEWVSQRHARLWCTDGKCWIEDQESTNGTFLIITGRTPLRRGSSLSQATCDEILVGGFKIRVIDWKM